MTKLRPLGVLKKVIFSIFFYVIQICCNNALINYAKEFNLINVINVINVINLITPDWGLSYRGLSYQLGFILPLLVLKYFSE